jgi:ABC-type transporter Mla subunit MlaD
MPKRQHSELAAGAFVVAGLAALLGVVLWLGAADMFRTRGQLVTFYVPQIGGSVGIIPGAELTCGDGRVGRVVDVQPEPGVGKCFYHARMERSDVTVKQDARAEVVSPPIGQAKIVLLDLGKVGKPSDDQHPIRLTGGLDQAMRHIGTFTDNVEVITEVLRAEFDAKKPDSLLAEIHNIAGQLDTTAKGLATITGRVEAQTKPEDANTILGHVRRTVANLDRETNGKAKDTFMGDLKAAAGNLRTATDPNVKDSLLAKANVVVDGLKNIVQTGEPKINRALDSVVDATGLIDNYAKKDLAEIFEGFQKAKDKILKASNDLGDASEQVKEVVAINCPNLDQMIENLTQVSVDLKAVAKDAVLHPWKFLHKPTMEDVHSANIASAVRAFADGAGHLDEALAKLRALQKIPTDDPAFQATLEKAKKKLQETSDKFSTVEKALWEELRK